MGWGCRRRLQVGVATLVGESSREPGFTIPIMKKALFHADEAALKRGDMSGSLQLRTIRLKSSSWARAVPTSEECQLGFLPCVSLLTCWIR